MCETTRETAKIEESATVFPGRKLVATDVRGVVVGIHLGGQNQADPLAE